MTPREPLKRRHHTVPRFYLQRFADEHRQLRRVALPGDKRALVSVGDATVEKDFYLIEQEDGTRTDALENYLAEIEADAAPALRALVDDRVWPIPDHVRQAIAIWAASQALRTTTQRRSHTDIADMLLKLQIGIEGKPGVRNGLRKQYGREPTEVEVDERWEKLTDFDSYEATPHPNGSLRSIVQMLPKTAAAFHARAFWPIYFRCKTLVTCDNPIFLVPAFDHPQDMGIGMATAGQILIPLDRRAALILGDYGAKDIRQAGSTALARAFNQAMAVSARQAIFHHPADDPLAGLELPQPRRRVTGGYEQLQSFVFPEGMAAVMRAAGPRA